MPHAQDDSNASNFSVVAALLSLACLFLASLLRLLLITSPQLGMPLVPLPLLGAILACDVGALVLASWLAGEACCCWSWRQQERSASSGADQKLLPGCIEDEAVKQPLLLLEPRQDEQADADASSSDWVAVAQDVFAVANLLLTAAVWALWYPHL